jgi:hypothetical protein
MTTPGRSKQHNQFVCGLTIALRGATRAFRWLKERPMPARLGRKFDRAACASSPCVELLKRPRSQPDRRKAPRGGQGPRRHGQTDAGHLGPRSSAAKCVTSRWGCRITSGKLRQRRSIGSDHSIGSDQVQFGRHDGGRQPRRCKGLEEHACLLSAILASKHPQFALTLGLDVGDLHGRFATPADGAFVAIAHVFLLPEPKAMDLISINPWPMRPLRGPSWASRD